MKIGTLLRKLAIRFVVLLVLFLGVMSIINCSGHRSLRAELAQWEQAGLLLEPERGDGRAWREAEAAYATLSRQAVQLLNEGPDEDAELRQLALDETAEARAAIAEAVGETGTLPIDADAAFDEQVEQRLQRLAYVRQFTGLLDGAARTYAAQGRPHDAAAALQTLGRLSAYVGRDASLVAHLVRLAMDAQLLASMHAVYADARLHPPDGLPAALAATDYARRFNDMLRGEAAMVPAFIDSEQQARVARGWWQHDQRYTLEHKRALIHAIGQGTPLRELAIPTDDDHPWWSRSAGVILPAIDDAREQTLRVAAKRGQALVALRLREHRRETGAYPDSLAAALGDEPDATLLDPFTGQAFDYQRHGEGFVLTATTGDGEAVTWRWDE